MIFDTAIDVLIELDGLSEAARWAPIAVIVGNRPPAKIHKIQYNAGVVEVYIEDTTPDTIVEDALEDIRNPRL